MSHNISPEDLLKLILQWCKDHGDPADILLHELDASFYCRVSTREDDCKPFPGKGNKYSALDLVKKAIRDKPGNRHPLGTILIRPSPRGSNAARISLYNLVSCMHNYPFRRGTDVDIDAHAAMLLTGPEENISFKYFLLRKSTLRFVPHMFIDDSPVVLLSLCLQNPTTVGTFLRANTVDIDDDLDALTARLLGKLQQVHGGEGFVETFKDLQLQMQSRFPYTLVTKYAGCNGEDTYSAVSDKPASVLKPWGASDPNKARAKKKRVAEE